MSCLKSIVLRGYGDIDASNLAFPYYEFWEDNFQKYSAFKMDVDLVSSGSGPFTWFPEGFKNIDLYKVDLLGSIQVWRDTSVVNSKFVANDFNYTLELDGQFPTYGRVPGNTTSLMGRWRVASPGVFGYNQFKIGKTNKTLEFSTPVKSLKSLKLTNLYFDGLVPFDPSPNFYFSYDLSLIVHYKFEGE